MSKKTNGEAPVTDSKPMSLGITPRLAAALAGLNTDAHRALAEALRNVVGALYALDDTAGRAWNAEQLANNDALTIALANQNYVEAARLAVKLVLTP